MALHDAELKTDVLSALRLITKIPEYVLADSDLQFCSVAQKMSWASTRSTTRIEDRAYSLLGLFDVQMPMLYGEGEKAFQRLQGQIIRTSNDDSIFSWEEMDATPATYRGLFTRSSWELRDCANVRVAQAWQSRFELSNLGLRINLPMVPLARFGGVEAYIAFLKSSRFNHDNTSSLPIHIYLARLEHHTNPVIDSIRGFKYARIFPKAPEFNSEDDNLQEHAMYTDIKPSLPPRFRPETIAGFRFVRSPTAGDHPLSKITAGYPTSRWDCKAIALHTRSDLDNFLGVVEVVPVLRTHLSERESHWARAGCNLMVGFDRNEGAWCKLLEPAVLGSLDDDTHWREIGGREAYDAIRPSTAAAPQVRTTSLNSFARQWSDRLGVVLRYGLIEDRAYAIVEIEGLIDV